MVVVVVVCISTIFGEILMKFSLFFGYAEFDQFSYCYSIGHLWGSSSGKAKLEADQGLDAR